MALQQLLGLPCNPTFKFCDEKDEESAGRLPQWNQTQLPLAPRNYLACKGEFIDTAHGKRIQLHFDKGTTTLGFKFQGGVVIAADSRSTGGEFISSYTIRKVIHINDYLLGTMAGCAADCVYWDRVLTQRCRMHELRNRERISVAAASKMLANMLYNYKGMDLSVGSMVAGWDKKGPALFYVDNEGNRFPGATFGAGSGSPYAFGVFDQGFDWNMSDADACELARRAVYHATFRDSFSGGNIRVYLIKEKGWKIMSVDDCNDLHHKYQDEKML